VDDRRGRLLITAAAACLLLRATVGAQLPPVSVLQEVQQRNEGKAQEVAEDLARRSQGTARGFLHPDAALAFRWVDEAVQGWQKEKGAGAAPFLAGGVLLDCLSRLEGVKMDPVPSEGPKHPLFADVAALRRAAAVKAFDVTLKLDPTLVESRMRRARIRAQDDPKAAQELETIANDDGLTTLAYLAAVSRAVVARGAGDVAGAVRWYERALELNPRSAAAVIALSLIRPAGASIFGTFDANDPFYTYPCSVLTPHVASELAARVKAVVSK